MDGGITTVCTYYIGVAVGGRTAYISHNIPRAPMSIHAWVRGESALAQILYRKRSYPHRLYIPIYPPIN
jgi:hypothetical protein